MMIKKNKPVSMNEFKKLGEIQNKSTDIILQISKILKKTQDNVDDSINFCKYILEDTNNISPLIKGLVISSTMLSISIIYSTIPFNVIYYSLNKKKK